MRKTMRYIPYVASMVLCLGVVDRGARADTWGQFRGETGDGVSRETGLPRRWSADAGLAWSVALPGRGNSSPAITSRRVDLTTQTSDGGLWVVSVDRATGKLIRKVSVGQGKLAAKGPANLYAHRHNAATPTPVSDDDHIWAYFGSGLLVCIDARSGAIKWKRDLASDYGAYDITFGMGSSPRGWQQWLYVACMTKGVSYVVALDKVSGREVWKADRKLPAADDGPDAYSSPILYRAGDRWQLMVSGSDHVNAYDVRRGTQAWIADGMKINSPYGRIIASPVAASGILLATSANPAGAGKGHVMAVRIGQGDIAANRLWKHTTSTPDSSTPVIVDGRVFMIADNGVAACVELKSGKLLWRKRLKTGTYHASAVAGDGHVYFLNIEGVCSVIAADGSGTVRQENQLNGLFYATPAISDGHIYLRAYDRLYAVEGH